MPLMLAHSFIYINLKEYPNNPISQYFMYTLYLLLAALVGLALGWYLSKVHHSGLRKNIEGQLQTIQQQLLETKEDFKKSQAESLLWREKAIQLDTINTNLTDQLAEQQQNLQKIEDKLSIQFKNLANDLLEEKSKKFTDQNKLNLETLLKPLGERIQLFEKQVDQTNKEGIERNVALRTEINRLYSLNLQITKEAENLTRAIKGDNKIQGNWGEWILETILEQSGLVKGREYQVQPSMVSEDGKRYQPDIVLQLPTNKKIIIDAKVSLVNYEQFFNTDQPEEKATQLKKHIHSLRTHIYSLSEKNYQKLPEAIGLDFVVLFVPIEPALNLVLENDSTISSEAYKKNIMLTSPSSLIAIIRTVANIWKQDYQNQNAIEIARQSGALYDKFVSFTRELIQVGRQIESTHETYKEAMAKLCEGKDNLIRKTERLKSLGASTTKSLDPKLLTRAQASSSIPSSTISQLSTPTSNPTPPIPMEQQT